MRVRMLVAAGVTVMAMAGAEAAAGDGLMSHIRQLTFEGKRAGEGYFSADGGAMIFQSERQADNPFYQMYVMDLGTGDLDRVSPGHGKTTCGWIHPDGGRVMFSSTHDDPGAPAKQRAELDFRASGKQRRYSWDYDETYEIYDRDGASGTYRNLTKALGYDAEGSYSPDGKLIAFASNRHAYAAPMSEKDAARFENDKAFVMDLYLMNADGSDVRRLTEARGYDGGPFFSSDGSKIVWRRFSEDGHTAEIFTMNVDGSEKKAITRLGAMSWAPFFHPSGEYVIFATNLHGYGNFELYMVDAEGRHEPVRVTDAEGFDGLPAFSPNGARLAWTSKRTPDQTSQIFLATWNHAEARRRLGLETVSVAELRRHVAALASEEMEGRLTGSPGERRATDYVAAAFREIGLKPAGDDGTFFQTFEFAAGASLGAGNRLTLEGTPGDGALALDTDWRPLAFSGTGDVEAADVVFAGYGLVTPDGTTDSYQGLDVTGKWVVVFRFLPEDIDRKKAAGLLRYADLQYKAAMARQKGAAGLVIVSGPNARVEKQLVRATFDAAGGSTSMPVVSVTDAVARAMLGPAGKDLKAVQDGLDRGGAVSGFALPGVLLGGHIAIERERRTGRNVLARLSAGTTAPPLAIGAHVDHLGRGEASGSLARDDERGQVHFGADDNASGVAGLIAMARHLARLKATGHLKAKRDFLFAAWSGEELGLLGSTHFVDGMGGKGAAAYLNMDMIGRLESEVFLQGVGSSSVWKRVIERRNAPVGLSIVTDSNTYLSTDATPFYLKGVPVLSAFTGAHSEYSSPRDTADRINHEGIARIAGLMTAIALDLARADSAPDYLRRQRPKGSVGRKHLRVYLGTVPDYGRSDTKGVRISGTAEGGPAEKAGLLKGDIIRRLAGTDVENIYDFMGALALLKADEATEVMVLRGGEEVSLSIVPKTRE